MKKNMRPLPRLNIDDGESACSEISAQNLPAVVALVAPSALSMQNASCIASIFADAVIVKCS